jgi:uncharacterized membrane protein
MPLPLYMDAEIRQNRSLSPRGFWVLIGVVAAANAASALIFLAKGAVLVAPFLGAGVAALAVALLASFRAAKVVERVQVSPVEIRITRETPRAKWLIWKSPTAFTRVLTERDEEDRVTALRLRLSGRQTAVAAALSPRERGEFARALEDAIGRARRHRD